MLPYFSVCIPHYGRTSFVLKALESVAQQTFRDCEVCISDDVSPDGRLHEVEQFLARSGLRHVVKRQERNQRYDANIRAAIALASGRYCLLLGNDDALAQERALQVLHDRIEELGPCGVAVTDYEDYATSQRSGRVRHTRNYGAGPAVAAAHFRNFSFVSGVVLTRVRAQQCATAAWDGAEMYQTYVACRLIATGASLLEISESLIRKDIRIEGESVDSYARRPRVSPCPITERPIPLVQLARLIGAAIAPDGQDGAVQAENARILSQVVRYTYPFWLVEYRRVQSWRYAAGVALAMRPKRIAAGLGLSWLHRVRLHAEYLLSTIGGLLTPLGLFDALRPSLYRFAKRQPG